MKSRNGEENGCSHASHDFGVAKLCIRRACCFAKSPCLHDCSHMRVEYLLRMLPNKRIPTRLALHQRHSKECAGQ